MIPILLLLGAWFAPPLPTADPERAQRLYNELFPTYVEVCTVTQYDRKDGAVGGPGGHATMFLHGACRDESVPYPRLKVCEPDPADPDGGTGVSVNRVFKNVNWVAIPGRRMFFRGGLYPGEALTQAAYERVQRDALKSGWFRGIELHEAEVVDRPKGTEPTAWVVDKSVGTDFALNFARTAYCARLPLDSARVTKVVDYLNGLNEQARREGYVWNPFTNNCSHAVHNALAAAGVFAPKTARGPGTLDEIASLLSTAKAVVGKMSDLSFPANNFVRVYEAGNERPLDRVDVAFFTGDMRRTLDEGWLSTGPGALIQVYPLISPNEVFDPGRDPLIASVPLLWPKGGAFERLTKETPLHLLDLRANLAAFRRRYAEALTRRERWPAQFYVERPNWLRSPEEEREFLEFYGRFYAKLEADARALGDRIARYERLNAR